MIDVRIAELEDFDQDDSTEAEALVRAAFGDGFRTHDWLHGVDGVHVLITQDEELVAHASVVTRTLWHGGEPHATGYVEAVAVRGDHRGRGLGRVVMDHVEAIISARYQLGALNAVESAAPFYAARGWRAWTGHTQAHTPDGVMDTLHPDDRIFVLTTARPMGRFSASSPLVCDWREGDLWQKVSPSGSRIELTPADRQAPRHTRWWAGHQRRDHGGWKGLDQARTHRV